MSGPPSSSLSDLQRYAAWWGAISPESIEAVPSVFTPEVQFSDPFNTVYGHGGMQAVLRHMFAGMQDPRFGVTDIAPVDGGGFLKWRFQATSRRGGVALDFEGVSEVRLGPDGRVRLHRDYWDSSGPVYGQVPVLGWGIRQLRRRLAVDPKYQVPLAQGLPGDHQPD